MCQEEEKRASLQRHAFSQGLVFIISWPVFSLVHAVRVSVVTKHVRKSVTQINSDRWTSLTLSSLSTWLHQACPNPARARCERAWWCLAVPAAGAPLYSHTATQKNNQFLQLHIANGLISPPSGSRHKSTVIHAAEGRLGWMDVERIMEGGIAGRMCALFLKYALGEGR